jgi:hypothetical protein
LTIKKAVTFEVLLIITIVALFLPGGDDLYRFYLPFARGCLECGFAPYHASWILHPITLIPSSLLWPVWVFFTALCLIWASHRLNTNGLLVLLTFPAMGQIWLGQVDGILAIGLVLALLGTNPYVRGAGLLLASIKPHVAGAAIIVLLWYERERWKTLVIPLTALLISLVVWGFDWPIQWLRAHNEPPLHVWRLAALFPYGLLAFFSLFWLEGKHQKVQGALLASSLGMPFYGTYSYTTFLIFLAPWWAVPVSYAWFLAYPWYGNGAMRFAWILPVSLLVYLLWPSLKKCKFGKTVEKNHTGERTKICIEEAA